MRQIQSFFILPQKIIRREPKALEILVELFAFELNDLVPDIINKLLLKQSVAIIAHGNFPSSFNRITMRRFLFKTVAYFFSFHPNSD